MYLPGDGTHGIGGNADGTDTYFDDTEYDWQSHLPSVLTVNPTSSLSGFQYAYNAGPSEPQSFTVTGFNLSANVTVTAPDDFEITLNTSGDYSSSCSITPTDGSVTSTVYVRMKANLSTGSHTGTLTVACDDLIRNIALSGTVSEPTLALDANRWYAISSPRHDAGYDIESVPNVTNLIPATGAYDLYYYDEPNTTWVNYKDENDGGFNHLEQGHGYIYRRSTASPALDFTGEDNTADVEVELTATPDAGSLMGFNLVGNPFLRNYTLNRDCYNLTTNGVWTVNEGSYTLGIAEAVMVKATSDETLTFTYNEEENVGAKAGRSAALAFTLAGNGFEDVAYARFAYGEGMPKLAHLNSAAPMLSIAVDSRRYAIANLADDCQSFPLTLRATAGEYTITLNSELRTHNYLHLIDHLTGRDIDLLATPAYTFTATTNDADRFTVKLSPEAAETNGNFVYWNGSAWMVEGNGTLGVYDVMGRQLFSGEVNDQLSILNSQFPSTGVYIIRLGEKSQKIVVK